MFTSNKENNKIDYKFYAPVRCNVTIMYATSSTNDSSSLAEVYFVALCQNIPLLVDFSTIVCCFNMFN
jgi:hypothetical protein